MQAGNSASGEGIGDALGWFPVPAVPGGAGPVAVMGGGNGYVVGADAPDAALDFLKFFLLPENMPAIVEVENIIPVSAGVVYDFDENALAIIDAVAAADYFQLYYDQLLPPAVGQAVLDACAALFAQTATAEEAAQMIEDSAAMEM